MASFFHGVLRFRLLVLAIAAGILATGVVQLRTSPVDLLPEFTPPYAEIQTEALGLSADEVEQLITVPLEADLLNGVEGVEVIRSESLPGLSSVVLVFARGTDVYRARQLVEERLTQAHALPNVSKPPTLLQPLSSSNRVLMIGMSSTDLSLIEQSVIARWTVRPQLMGVPGVANVSVWGMRDQQLQVQVDPARLRDMNIRLSQVVSTAGNAQVVSPLTFLEASTPGTGGFIETPQQRLQVRHLLEKIADPAELAKVPVEGTGGRMQLSDVAQVKIDHQPLIGDAVVSGGPGLFLVVEKFPGTDSIAVTEGVEEALEALRPGLTGLTSDTTVFRPADYLQEALGNIGLAALVGGVLMLLGFLAFGANWRTMVVGAVTVPLSVLSATLVLSALGHGVNALVLAGLAAATAVMVDEAVTTTDQPLRRLENAAALPYDGRLTVLGEAAAGVRPVLLAAAVVAALAVVPVAVLEGRPGAFFAPLVTAYALALAAAMVVAVTAAPALTALLLMRRPRAAREWPWTARIRAGYDAAVARFVPRLGPVVLAAAACALVALIVLPFLQVSLIPSFADRNVVVKLEAKPGASNTLMTQKTTEVVRAVEAVPGVESVGAHVGRAVTGDRTVNVSSSDVWVTIASSAEYETTVTAIEEAALSVTDLASSVVGFSTQEMRDVGALVAGTNPVTGSGLDVLTGLHDPVAVRIFGQDPKVLAEQAARVQEMMAGVDGVSDPRTIVAPTQPTIEIEVDLQKAQRLGVTPGDVRRAEATLLQGIQVGSVFEEQKVFDVIVQGVPSTRRTEADVRNLLIDRPYGAPITLGEVAVVRTVETPAVISRDAVSRRVDVVAGLDGRDAGAVAADLRSRLAEMDFPLEYHGEVVAQNTADEIGQARAIGFAVAAVLAAFLVFQAAFGSWRLALVMTVAAPLALSGGVLASLFTDRELSLGSLLGLLAAFGFALRTGMVMIWSLQRREREAAPDEARAATVAAGAQERLIPVLTSAVAVILLTVPFIVLGPRPGLELLHPLAVVLVGGVITAAFITLFVLPALYLHVGPGATRPDPVDRDLALAGTR